MSLSLGSKANTRERRRGHCPGVERPRQEVGAVTPSLTPLVCLRLVPAVWQDAGPLLAVVSGAALGSSGLLGHPDFWGSSLCYLHLLLV